METAIELGVSIPNHPGSLAHLSDMLRAADVNIEALFCNERSKDSTIYVVVDDPETAKLVLQKLGDVSETEVLAIRAHNKPGTIAHIARMCAGEKINISHIYATSLGKEAMVYLAVDDLEKAKKVLK
jgi:hypothetical protein